MSRIASAPAFTVNGKDRPSKVRPVANASSLTNNSTNKTYLYYTFLQH